jgi:hypothetical protein
MNASVAVDASGELSALLAASFSASADFQTLFPGGNDTNTAYVATSCACTLYSAQWSQFGWTPTFTADFLNGVKGLGASVPWSGEPCPCVVLAVAMQACCYLSQAIPGSVSRSW